MGMVQVRGGTSNRASQVGLAGGNLQAKNPKLKILVQVRGITSNRNLQVGLAGGNLQTKNPKSEILVPGGGFEPPTRGFSVRCSTPELPGHGSWHGIGLKTQAGISALEPCRVRRRRSERAVYITRRCAVQRPYNAFFPWAGTARIVAGRRR